MGLALLSSCGHGAAAQSDVEQPMGANPRVRSERPVWSNLRILAEPNVLFEGPDRQAGEQYLLRPLRREFRECARSMGAELVSLGPVHAEVTFRVHVHYAYLDVMRAEVETRVQLADGRERRDRVALSETPTADFAPSLLRRWRTLLESEAWPPGPVHPQEMHRPSLSSHAPQEAPGRSSQGQGGSVSMVRPRPRISADSVVAILDISGIPEDVANAASGYFVAAVTRHLGWKVVPRAQVRSVLRAHKRDSYRRCYESSCQIEIGRALAASLVLVPERIQAAGECALSANLFDLRTETTVASTHHRYPCTAPILEVIDHAIQDLPEAVRPPPPTSSRSLRQQRSQGSADISHQSHPGGWTRDRNVGFHRIRPS